MCGVVGFWHHGVDQPAAAAERMALRIAHRGPDDAGVWVDDQSGVALAHRRLSIIDLSPAGHQPMVSPCGRFVLTYNGEIYNHIELRSELEAEGGNFEWRGHSDTETLLASLRHWGVEETLTKLNGMFAFALWDGRDKRLFLARDRMGEKPLFYGQNKGVFMFGSELKALTAYPGWHGVVNRNSLSLYMRHNYVPSPWSIYEGIFKLPPAHYLVVEDAGKRIGQPVCYWDLASIAESGAARAGGDEKEMIDSLDELLQDSIGKRMMADVPLGAFLSGGYDSSLVVALMQAQSKQPVKTFSIGFHEEEFDEAHHARAIAAHLGTDHTEHYVEPAEALAVIPTLPTIWDEPFADSSQIPTFLVSAMARRQVKVSLSGDGGDELFCGYNRYLLGHNIWDKIRFLPTPVRWSISAMLAWAPGRKLDQAFRFLPKRMRPPNLEDRLPKLAEVLNHRDGTAFYQSLVSHWKRPDQVVRGSVEPLTLLGKPDELPKFSDFRQHMMYLDEMMYLPDDILVKVDRASMAVSLEARVPLLDHRLVEFGWQVPMNLKQRAGQGKWLLRQVLYRYVPRGLVDRPKMGFGVPIDQWLRGPLREWSDELLNEKRLCEEGFFDPETILRMWKEHISGERRWHYYLWNVLMFQAWLAEQ